MPTKKKKEKFCDVFRRLRKTRGLTQKDVAHMSGMDKGLIWNWEHDYSTPNLKSLLLLCEGLDISLAEFDHVTFDQK